jgi:hypothetical protein
VAAGSPFPQRKSQGSGSMTSADSSPLDGPPPSPVMPMDGGQMTPGQPAQMPTDFAAMGSAPLTIGSPGKAVSPEVSMGMMSTAESISNTFDSMASIAPDLATDFALLKQLLQQTMGKLLLKSGQTASPASAGSNFPGGGFGTSTM